MRKLSDSEIAVISGGIYEGLSLNCALSSAALVVSAFAGPVAAIAAGLTAAGACLDNNSDSSN